VDRRATLYFPPGVVQTALIAIVASPMLAFTVAFLAMLGLSRLQRG
jgi:hypothetical protein